jgi:hypothetical protein
MDDRDDWLHPLEYLDGRASRQNEIDAYLTSGRCLNDPPSRDAYRTPPLYDEPPGRRAPPVHRARDADDEFAEQMQDEQQADAIREQFEAQRQRDWERDQREQQQREFEQRMTAAQTPPTEEKAAKYQNDDAMDVQFDEVPLQPARMRQVLDSVPPHVEPVLDGEPIPF